MRAWPAVAVPPAVDQVTVVGVAAAGRSESVKVIAVVVPAVPSSTAASAIESEGAGVPE